MRIEPMGAGDWPRFLKLALAENWLVPKAERVLFQNGWSRYLYVFRTSGRICGFVSAVPHRSGGWIGNLIVDAELRKQGYGTILFDHAMASLRSIG